MVAISLSGSGVEVALAFRGHSVLRWYPTNRASVFCIEIVSNFPSGENLWAGRAPRLAR